MITLLHGENTEASRQALVASKQQLKGREYRNLEGKNMKESELIQALESSSTLSGQKPTVVIEHLLANLGRKTKSRDNFLASLIRSSANSDLILWEGKQIDPGVLKQLGSALREQLYNFPPEIFKLLDGLGFLPLAELLARWKQVIQREPAEIVYTLLGRRLRELVKAKENIFGPRVAPWQAAKLTKQAKYFTLEKLVAMERELLAAEYSLKTGNTPFSLSQHLETFLINNF